MSKITIITGKAGSGRTGYLFSKFKKDKDNFVITTDSSVYYIEKLMGEKKIPGKCVGISSLAKFIYQQIGGIKEEVISEEMQIIMLTDIMVRNFSNLSTLKVVSYNNSIVDDISLFINNCISQNILPKDLIDVCEKLGVLSINKLKDIALIYEEFLNELDKNNLINNVIFTQKIVELLKTNNDFSFKNIFVDSLNRYNSLNLDLLKALVVVSDEYYIAFGTISSKSYAYNIYKNSNEAYIDFDNHVISLKGSSIERISLKVNKEIFSGMDIIKDELFNRDTKTEAKTDDVFLHEASSIYKEVDFISSKIKELVEKGYSYDDIILTGTDLGLYKNIISNSFSKNEINSYYYKNKKFTQTVFYEFLKNLFLLSIENNNVNMILNIVNTNYFDFTQDEIVLLTNFFLRFGKDIDIALKNGEIYDNDNFLLVKVIIDKIYNFISLFTKKVIDCKTFSDYNMALYEYLEELNLQDLFFKQYKELSSKTPQIANEILETWNSFIKILDEISQLKGDKNASFEEYVAIFNKLCEESNIINSQEYCDEVKILDLKDAQNRKSKICFVLGCNEGKFPFDVSEDLISDIELTQINVTLGKKLILSSDKLIDAYYAIFSTLTLPSEKLFISWASNDPEARPMRYASILSNVVKSFSNNFIEEKRYYDNDKEEVFYDLLNNLSEFKKTGICSEDIDNEYWELSTDPFYSERLDIAIKNAVIDKQQINASDIPNSYKEKDFFGVTRLERFNSCPFKHYIEYALLPKYQKLFEETAANKGGFYHDILNFVFKYVEKNEVDIYSMNFEDFKKLVLPMIEKHLNNHNENVMESNITLKIEKNKMVRKILKTSWNAICQLKESDFEIFKTEFRIGRDIPLKITLDSGKTVNIIGVVDRIDKADINSDKYVRVIDYKSGLTAFSTEKINLGLQLQLPLYMKAIIGDYLPAGIYYSRIVDPIKDVDTDKDNISKKFQLNGITLADMSVLSASDRMLDGPSSSDIIQADITTKGEISKKSKVLDKKEFDELLEKAVLVASETISKILSGETKINPKKLSDYNACEYCEYKSICHK